MTSQILDNYRLEKNSHDLPDVLHPILKRVYLNRGVVLAKDLSRELKDILPYHNLKGIQAAVKILLDGRRL